MEILAAWEPLVITEIGGGMVKVQGRPPDHSAPQTDGSHSYVVESLAQILPEPAPLLSIPAQRTRLPLPGKDRVPGNRTPAKEEQLLCLRD